jgi:tRNA(adenine34) deaminase
MCAGAISQARVGRLVYGAADERYGCAGSVYRIPEDPTFNHFCPCDGGILEEECKKHFQAFFIRRRKEGTRKQ